MTFAVTTETMHTGVTKTRWWFKDKALSYEQALQAMGDSPQFPALLTDHLSGSPFAAFLWELPPVSVHTLGNQFEFVTVSNRLLADRMSDATSFAEHLTDASVVVFPNLGGDATLVVPCRQTRTSVYAHLASFLRGAPPDQIRQLWRVLAAQVRRRVSTKPLWVSTNGLGVSWLHVRIDIRAKYYNYRPYRVWPMTD